LIEKGIKMLDAPVSGNESGAKAGTLSIMVGGPKDVFEECLPIFEVLGKTIIHIAEENGAGQKTKLCNQVIGCINVLAMCEGLTLAVKLELDIEKVLCAIRAGGAASRALDEFGPMILRRNLEPGFFVKHFQKDLRIVMETAADLKIPLPGTALVHQLYSAVEADGLSEKGEQALIRAFEKLANIEVKR
jgi:3-hydroxyisobutyrate dehydrogenase